VARAPVSGERIGIVAGGGMLPAQIAQTLRKQGHDPFVIIVEGEPGQSPELLDFANVSLPIEKFGRFLSELKTRGVTQLVMAGSITRRPKLAAVEWTLDLLTMAPSMIPALAMGDDALLTAVIRQVERRGIRIIGPHTIVPDLIAPLGALTAKRPDRASQRDIDAALTAATAIGALDIGQAAVAIGGRTIALEGIEGTDGLLSRVKDLRSHGRLAGRAGGVLAKCSKPQQEVRADLPSIGSQTVRDAFDAGLAGIAVEAGRTFVIDFDAAVKLANELGLFIVGVQVEPKH